MSERNYCRKKDLTVVGNAMNSPRQTNVRKHRIRTLDEIIEMVR